MEVSVTFLSPIEVCVEKSLFKCVRSLIILAAIRSGSTISPFHVHNLWLERDGWENS